MFIHLSCVSAYSLKYGTTQPRDLIARAAEFELPALALTDRDSLAGVIKFVQAAKEYGIAPIVGINLTLDKNRVILLAQSDGGWRSLCRLVSALRTDRDAPVLNISKLKELNEYTKNLILLNGPESAIAEAVTRSRYDIALAEYNKYRGYFADSYIECVSHLIPGNGPSSTTHASRMLGFARDNDLPAVLTNAVRMLRPEDGPVADVLDAARKLVPLHPRHLERKNSEGH